MPAKTRSLAALSAVLVAAFVFTAPKAEARGANEYDKIVNHLKSRYKARKVRIPFLWFAKFAVKVVRPAGVKSFSVTLFEDLKFSREALDAEMQSAMRSSFGQEWSSVFRVRAREGQQAYMYIREAGRNVKLTLVTIDRDQAAVIRATVSPERLADFINNPRIFGISLRGDGEKLERESVKKKEKPPTN